MILRMVWKNLRRRSGRTWATVAGVASALLLLVLVDALRNGLDRALDGSASARTLIVYRQNRYCPQTSFLPEAYAERIRGIDGVVDVLPVRVFLNNCRASLDLVTFHGAPADDLVAVRDVRLVDGDLDQFRGQRDAALLGRAFAERRGLGVGDKFRFGAITVGVAGVFASDEPTDEGVVLTHLEFLQRAGPVDALGTVTQFEVRIDDASRAEAISRAIDATFATAQEPTDTRSRALFLAAATRDLREILRFASILGFGCVLVVLALVGNTILASVQERVAEFAVFRTIGYRTRHVLAMVLVEALVVAAIGSAVGIAIAFALLASTHLSIGVEGIAVAFTLSPTVALRGLLLALCCGVAAGLVPAIAAARRPIVPALRAG